MVLGVCESICQYDRQVTIQQLTDTVGPSGFPVESWTTLLTVWAQKLSGRQTERFNGDQLSGPLVTRWQTHWIPDLDPDTVDVVKRRRLLYLGRVYDITSAQEIGRRDAIELMTLAHTGD